MANKIDTFGFGKIDPVESNMAVTTPFPELIQSTLQETNQDVVDKNILTNIVPNTNEPKLELTTEQMAEKDLNLLESLSTIIMPSNTTESPSTEFYSKEIPSVSLNAIDTMQSFLPVMSHFTAIKRRPIHENNITIDEKVDISPPSLNIDILNDSDHEKLIFDNKVNRFIYIHFCNVVLG